MGKGQGVPAFPNQSSSLILINLSLSFCHRVLVFFQTFLFLFPYFSLCSTYLSLKFRLVNDFIYSLI